ncbi:MAG: hemerythrin family protein [Anaeromyxobacteraceae bacterium]
MPLVDLDAIPQVALPFVNHDHREEARLLNDLADAVAGHQSGKVPVEAVLNRLDALFEHTQEHFGREEEAMQKAGFPAYPVHKGEHERVLGEMEAEEVHFRETGDTARLTAYVTEGVPAWFIQHIQSMDAVTAQFVVMRGGG